MNVTLKTKYDIEYPTDNFKYYNANSGPRKRITKLLLRACNGYCMYCGKRVTVESNENYHIEHSVDKDGNGHQEIDETGALEHCKFNLAISCSECNQVCKKVVEKVDLLKYAPIHKCPKKCIDLCPQYNEIRKEYIKKNAIILQPIGIDSLGDGAVSYNLLKHIFEPSEEIHDEDSIFLIQNHIDRFKLNAERFSPEIINLCVKITGLIDMGAKDVESLFRQLELEKPENIIGIEFIKYLKCNLGKQTCKEIDRFCRMLVVLDAAYGF